jgi:hypothetical protein
MDRCIDIYSIKHEEIYHVVGQLLVDFVKTTTNHLHSHVVCFISICKYRVQRHEILSVFSFEWWDGYRKDRVQKRRSFKISVQMDYSLLDLDIVLDYIKTYVQILLRYVVTNVTKILLFLILLLICWYWELLYNCGWKFSSIVSTAAVFIYITRVYTDYKFSNSMTFTGIYKNFQ